MTERGSSGFKDGILHFAFQLSYESRPREAVISGRQADNCEQGAHFKLLLSGLAHF